MEGETRERIGILIAKVDAAHKRIDTIETDIKDALENIHQDLKHLNAHMNRGKGWAAAALLLAGLFGAGIFKLISMALSR